MNKTSRSNVPPPSNAPLSNVPLSEGTHDNPPRRPGNADSRLDSLRNEIRGSRQRVVSSNQALDDRQAMGDPEATGDDAWDEVDTDLILGSSDSVDTMLGRLDALSTMTDVADAIETGIQGRGGRAKQAEDLLTNPSSSNPGLTNSSSINPGLPATETRKRATRGMDMAALRDLAKASPEAPTAGSPERWRTALLAGTVALLGTSIWMASISAQVVSLTFIGSLTLFVAATVGAWSWCRRGSC